MNPSVLFVFALSVLLGVLRCADIALCTDAVTGLCVVGPVWWRYLALGIVVAAAVLAGRKSAREAEVVRGRQPLAGALAFVGAVCLLAAGGTQFLLGTTTSGSVRIILECLCAAWLSTLGHSWLSPKEWKNPAGGLYFAVAGSLIFYWNVLMRFMENSSSWYRVQPTAAVWQELAALMFLAALVRALFVPEPGNRKALCAAGFAAFALCLCWQLPQSVLLLAGSGVSLAVLPEFFAGLGMCCIGGIGGVCAVSCACGQT